jgi:hypothetical protein
MPVRWKQTSILVMDDVLIEPPYTSESCKLVSKAENTLIRVKKVVQGTRKRLGINEG